LLVCPPLPLPTCLQDPRVGLVPRLLAFLAIAYALSPLDLIPDFIPVLGLLDDLIILPGQPGSPAGSSWGCLVPCQEGSMPCMHWY
jgi:hypothetical protein